MFYDWAGGLIWVAMPFDGEPGAAAIRDAVASVGGHATLIRAPAAVRASTEVFEPEEAGLAALNKRVKEQLRSQGRAQPRPHVGGGVIDGQRRYIHGCRPRAGGDPYAVPYREGTAMGPGPRWRSPGTTAMVRSTH